LVPGVSLEDCTLWVYFGQMASGLRPHPRYQAVRCETGGTAM
jgi:hypothetical protein